MSGGLGVVMEKGVKKARGNDEEDLEVNGEMVERRAREAQWVEVVRMGVSGFGEFSVP